MLFHLTIWIFSKLCVSEISFFSSRIWGWRCVCLWSVACKKTWTFLGNSHCIIEGCLRNWENAFTVEIAAFWYHLMGSLVIIYKRSKVKGICQISPTLFMFMKYHTLALWIKHMMITVLEIFLQEILYCFYFKNQCPLVPSDVLNTKPKFVKSLRYTL